MKSFLMNNFGNVEKLQAVFYEEYWQQDGKQCSELQWWIEE
jgi:hypothetical protein